ncbi:MAG: hypothetical protein WA796_11590 [Pseudolabrys sp.]
MKSSTFEIVLARCPTGVQYRQVTQRHFKSRAQTPRRETTRSTFLEAIEAWHDWRPGDPEPVVEHGRDIEPSEIMVSQACAWVLGSGTALPDRYGQLLIDAGLSPLQPTYGAAAAKAILEDIRNKQR